MTDLLQTPEQEKDEHEDFFMDIRRKRMWENYIKPTSETLGNAYASAIKAGYKHYYAKTITCTGWFIDKMRRLNLLSKAEEKLEKALTMDTTDPETGAEKADLMRVQTDVAKFVAKTLGKDEGYSERTEVTGKDGQGIVFMPVELMDKYNLTQTEETK